jgi:uncharacterized membrane protein
MVIFFKIVFSNCLLLMIIFFKISLFLMVIFLKMSIERENMLKRREKQRGDKRATKKKKMRGERMIK